MAALVAGALLGAARDVAAMGDFAAAPAPVRPDCVRLSRKVGLLSHFLEEVRDFVAGEPSPSPPSSAVVEVGASSSSSSLSAADFSCLDELRMAVEAARRFLADSCRPRTGNATSDIEGRNIAIQFQYLAWQLEKVLENFPYDHFAISEEVQEEVELVRVQLRRATEKCKTPHLKLFSVSYERLSRAREEVKQQSSCKAGASHVENTALADLDFGVIDVLVAEVFGNSKSDAEHIRFDRAEGLKTTRLMEPSKTLGVGVKSSNLTKMTPEELKRSDSIVIPEDFRCPISLELMRDPVIVSTGQTYERSFIQRWIDCGNRTCPKTQQKLQNLTLTPNYVLRSLIMQWCETHRIQQPRRSMSARSRKIHGSFDELNGDRATIDALVHNLSSISSEERKSSAAEIRSLAKRSTDNRILIAEAGAIPALINLLSEDDQKIQEHAVTSLLNLSIYDINKETIILAGAIKPMIKVLKTGCMEARENAAAAIFSLSLIDENKITIGSTPGAIEALVELLQNGSSRGKKDAATALFNLCIYHGNKVRAVRSGILTPLLKMLKDTSAECMVDEALTILSVLVSQQEGKVAIAKANTIPLLIDLLRTGLPRNKENAAAILVALCKKDNENLACLGRLGALVPITELAKSGTDRAKRKATSLLEHLRNLQML